MPAQCTPPSNWLRTIFWAAILLYPLVTGVGSPSAPTGQKTTGQCSPPRITHFSVHGQPKYGVGFTHFGYANPHAPKGGEIRKAVVAPGFDTFNPYSARGKPAAGTYELFAKLLEFSEDEPRSSYSYAAECFEVAPDKKSATFYLREGITFHDGSPIRPEDVVFTFDQIKNHSLPFLGTYYQDVIAARKTGPRAVTFDFAKPDTEADLVTIIGRAPIFSELDHKKNPLTEVSLKPPLGSGPYRVKDFEPGRRITYERVKGWWGENLPVNKGLYNFDTIVILYFKDTNAAFEAFKKGDVDVRQESMASRWETEYTFPAVKDGRVQRRSDTFNQPVEPHGLFFNTRRAKFQDRRVRRALAEAMDFEWLNKSLLYNHYRRTQSLFTNTEFAAKGSITPAEKEILKPYAKDIDPTVLAGTFTFPKTNGSGQDRAVLAHADTLLKEAGWVLEKGKRVNAKTKEPLEITLVYGLKESERYLQNYVNNLNRLGITVRLLFLEQGAFLQRLDDFDFDLILHRQPAVLLPGAEQRGYWGSEAADHGRSFNIAGVKNKAIDALIERLLAAPTAEAHLTLSRALDRFIISEFYFIPFWYPAKVYMAYWKHIGMPTLKPLDGVGIHALWDKRAEKK